MIKVLVTFEMRTKIIDAFFDVTGMFRLYCDTNIIVNFYLAMNIDNWNKFTDHLEPFISTYSFIKSFLVGNNKYQNGLCTALPVEASGRKSGAKDEKKEKNNNLYNSETV